ncbi:IPT/TIG domain-containing protein [Marinoscillum furvescens]|uniref:Uncharacterized protein DUF4979 n=1 Tax=Marinoscillum furvescens DSM 4134 TaxID=1122208 RepID=A0A3D9L0L2_MARFU|nr:DUF4979 domain-containing protein [Marinoscillum furvescens]RED95971.1 uncharacterized protein DUF4979 [Marinoscillum furvescens DSM 4134]
MMTNKLKKRWGKALMLISCLGLIVTIISCTEDSPEPPSTAPEIISFSPNEGRVGTVVTILGKNFSSQTNSVKVSFDGVEASVEQASESLLVVSVPAGATTGTLSVVIFGEEAVSEESFTVATSHSVTAVSPEVGEAGDQVTITGSNFGTSKSEVSVSFTGTEEDVEAVVVSVTDTEIVAVVPDGGSTGPLKVQVGPEAVESSFDFTFPFFGFANEFVESAEGWSSDASLSLADEALVVDFGGGNQASLAYEGEVVFNPDKFPILAIRMTRLADFELSLVSSLGTFGDGANTYTGIIDGDIYYYDLTEGDYVTAETLVTDIEFQIAKSSGESNFNVQWIRSFESVATLKSYDPFPVGKFLWEFDNEPGDDERKNDWLPTHGGTYQIANSQIKVEFAQTTGDRRADLYHLFMNTFPVQGVGVDDPRNNITGDPKHPYHRNSVTISKDYPIFAVKFGERDRPPVGKVDGEVVGSFVRDFAFGEFQLSDATQDASTKAGDRLYYWNNWDNSHKQVPEDLNEVTYEIFQIKMAGFDPDYYKEQTGNDLTGYDIDWIGTFESVEAMNAYNLRFE